MAPGTSCQVSKKYDVDMAPTDYDPSAFPPVFVTVDVVVFTVVDGQVPDGPEGELRKRLDVLLIERGADPFEGAWALPGGFVQQQEDLLDAAGRELWEEVGIDLDPDRLHQLGAYGEPGRDPRARIVSVAYVALAHDLPAPEAGTDARGARLVPVRDIHDGTVDLAFDHRRIVDDALEYARRLIEETDAALDFLPEYFTINELRDVYQAVWRFPVERTGFHKRVMGIPGFIERADESEIDGVMSSPPNEMYESLDASVLSLMSLSPSSTPSKPRGRPPKYFTRGSATHLDPPLRRAKPRAKRSMSD